MLKDWKNRGQKQLLTTILDIVVWHGSISKSVSLVTYIFHYLIFFKLVSIVFLSILWHSVHYIKIQSEAKNRKCELYKQSLIIMKTWSSFPSLTYLLKYSYKMGQRTIVVGKIWWAVLFFFFMLIILWLFTDESDELLSTQDSILMCPLAHEKLGWDHLNSFLLRFWTSIKNVFVLDLVGLRNENAIMSRKTHQSNLLPRFPILFFFYWNCYTICDTSDIYYY